VGIVTLRLVFGSTIVIVWSSLGKFLTVDSVRTSKGRPSKMLYAGDRIMWIWRYSVMELSLQGTLRARPSDWLTSPLADCILSFMDGLYARPMSWQTASDMAIIWDPGSMIPSTSSLLSTTIVIDRRVCDSCATLRGMGHSPGAKLLM
jgi:hypothetical protein